MLRAMADARIAGGTLFTRIAWKGALFVNKSTTAKKIAGRKNIGR